MAQCKSRSAAAPQTDELARARARKAEKERVQCLLTDTTDEELVKQFYELVAGYEALCQELDEMGREHEETAAALGIEWVAKKAAVLSLVPHSELRL